MWHLYELKLADGCFYIGITSDPVRRLREHSMSDKRSASFVRKHPLLEVIRVTNLGTPLANVAKDKENEITLKYIRKYGHERVRGGHYAASGVWSNKTQNKMRRPCKATKAEMSVEIRMKKKLKGKKKKKEITGTIIL